jgi:four helix bundle protein
MNATELQIRPKSFAYRIVVLCESLPSGKTSKIIEDQLLRSASSAAANYRAQSDKVLKAKLCTAFEETEESLFWLEARGALKLIPATQLTFIVKEADKLTGIPASSGITLERKSRLKS